MPRRGPQEHRHVGRQVKSLAFGVAAIIVLAGCSGFKTQVKKDLTEIVAAQDCESTCELLKKYIAEKLK